MIRNLAKLEAGMQRLIEIWLNPELNVPRREEKHTNIDVL